MITVTGPVSLALVGADERVFEGVYANVTVEFSRGKATLKNVTLSEDAIEFIETMRSEPQHWIDAITTEFNESGDFILDEVVEGLDDDEYAKAEKYITAYYKGLKMPDAVATERVVISSMDLVLQAREDHEKSSK